MIMHYKYLIRVQPILLAIFKLLNLITNLKLLQNFSSNDPIFSRGLTIYILYTCSIINRYFDLLHFRLIG